MIKIDYNELNQKYLYLENEIDDLRESSTKSENLI